MAREYEVRVAWSAGASRGSGVVLVSANTRASARRAAVRRIRATIARAVNRSRTDDENPKIWTEDVRFVRKDQ